MIKQVIILTKSTKYKNLCVAGIDPKTNDWIRLENKNQAAGAVTEADITYADGTICQELDVIEVECLEENANSNYQSENVFINTNYRLRKIGRSSWQEVLKMHPAEVRQNILGINRSFISEDFVTKRTRNASLQLIEVKNLTIFKSELDDDGNSKHPRAAFTYVNKSQAEMEYTLPITDPDYHPAKEERRLDKAYLIVSLGVPYNRNHYLLIAKIVEELDEPYYITTSNKTGIKYFHTNKNCSLLKKIGSTGCYSSGRIARDGILPCQRCDNS